MDVHCGHTRGTAAVHRSQRKPVLRPFAGEGFRRHRLMIVKPALRPIGPHPDCLFQRVLRVREPQLRSNPRLWRHLSFP